MTNKNSKNNANQLITGVDIVNVNRIERIVLKKRDQFYNKIFTSEEIDYIKSKGNKPTTVSGLFAAKEAVGKALGSGIGSVGWKDIQILHESNGRPYINLLGRGKKKAEVLGVGEVQISISHERDYAIAFVVGYII